MHSKKGMTLVEIMVSVVLILICIGGVTALIYQSAATSHSVYYGYIASNLAKNRIEWLREYRVDKGYSALADLSESQIEMIDFYGKAGEDFERTTEVAYSSGQTQIKVTVEYKKQQLKVPIKVELVTLFFMY